MIIAHVGFANHHGTEEQLKERLMIRSWNVGEWAVELIKQVPIDVGLLVSQPPLSHGSSVVTGSATPERTGLDQFRDVAIERAFGHHGRESG